VRQKTPGIKEGLAAGLPIVLGYFPISMAFGLLAKGVHISLLDSCLFSLVVFAGASQFMALDLIQTGIPSLDIIIATLLLNLRHLMMSASLAVRLRESAVIPKVWLPFIAFGITDESFSVASLRRGKLSVSYLLALQGGAYLAWFAGTFTGYLAGSALPTAVQSSMGVGLYAMFTAILTPEIKKSRQVLLLTALSGGLYACIALFRLLPTGWGLIVTIVGAAALGVILLPDKEAEVGE